MKNDRLQELNKYSKTEIIEALSRIVLPFSVVESLLAKLEHIKCIKAIEEHAKASKAETAACSAYIEWQREMIAKYGDGNTVKFNQIPLLDLRHGSALNNAWDDARRKERLLRAKVDRLLNLEEAAE